MNKSNFTSKEAIKISEKEIILNDNIDYSDTLFQLNSNLNYAESLKSKDISGKNFISMNINTECTMSKVINYQNGHVSIVLDKEVSDILLNKQITSVSMNDFDNLPFKSFILDMEHLPLVENILVFKQDNTLCLQFNKIGKECINLQIVIKENKKLYKKTFSSYLYEKYTTDISNETNDLLDNYFSYSIAAILYIINFNNNKEMVVKDMYHDKYTKKLTHAQLKKSKYKKKASKKRNIVTLKLPDKQMKYLNSENKGHKYVKCTTPFLVIGYWRNQRVDKRSEGKTKLIWIKPFFKCTERSNNIDIVSKVYEVS